jgi:TolB-like protein
VKQRKHPFIRTLYAVAVLTAAGGLVAQDTPVATAIPAADTGQTINALSESIIAVIPFRNAGSQAQFNPLQTGLADMVITDLAQVKSLQLVERTRMNAVLRELALDQAGLTVESNRIRVARQLQAGRVVGGAFKCDDTVSISIKGGFMAAGTGTMVAVEPFSGQLAKLFNLEKEFVFAIIAKMNIILSDQEREQIRIIPTENLQAFMAYSQGLEASDRGDFAAARLAFEKAAQLDPTFKQANNQISAMTPAPIAAQEPQPAPDAQTAQEPLVVYTTSGPAATTPAQTAQATDAPMATAAAKPALRIGFNAGSPTATRIATLTQAGFMPEVAVHESMPATAQSATAGEQQISQGIAENTAHAVRPAFSDAHNLGLDNAQRVNLIIELPVAP